jgi:DnaB-helicase binding domain of primase
VLPSAPPSDPQAQAKLAAPVVELLTPVKDPILRWAYGRRAAERMGVPFELLSPRLGPAPQAARRTPAVRATTATSRAHGRGIEEATLRLLLAMLPGSTSPQPEVLPALEELPPAEAFWDPACRHLYEAFCAIYQEGAGGPVELATLRAALEAGADHAGFDLFARLVIEGADAPSEAAAGAAVRAGGGSCADRLRDHLHELHQRWREQRSQQLNREMLEAQRSGDATRLERLVEEKSELSRAIHSRAKGRSSAGGDRDRAWSRSTT